MNEYKPLSHEEREAIKQDIMSSIHCALPGKIVSYDSGTQRAEVQPAVKIGSLFYPILYDVPVFMPIETPVDVGDPCLLIFSDIDIDAWLSSGNPEEPLSARKHSLSDAFVFVGFRQEDRTGIVSKAGAGLCPALPNENATTKYFRQDGQWVAPPFAPSSVLPGDQTSIKFRCMSSGYASSSIYYKLCTLPKSSNSTRPSALIRGRLGGWTSNNTGLIQAIINNRDSATMSSFMQTAASAEANVFEFCRIACYREDDGTMSIYLRAYNYFSFDLDIEANNCTIVFDGSHIASPTGTLVLSSETVASRMSLCGSTLSVNGVEK